MSNQQADDALPISNTLFPPPPPYFQAFTDEAVERYRFLTGRSSKSKGESTNPADHTSEGREMEVDGDIVLTEEEEKEWLELDAKMGKPRVDWVHEDGRWMCYDEMYTSKPTIPTAASIGLVPFVDPAEEPQTALPPLLHSFLHTLLLLLDTLTVSARTPGELAGKWASEGDQYIQHLSNLCANMMVSSNQLRSAQSEATLVLLMEKELEERKKQTELLRAKCKDVASGIQALKALRKGDIEE